MCKPIRKCFKRIESFNIQWKEKVHAPSVSFHRKATRLDGGCAVSFFFSFTCVHKESECSFFVDRFIRHGDVR